MNLKKLLEDKDVKEYIIEIRNLLDNVEIINIRNDSRLVEKGSLFAAIKGVNHDGINYLNQAIKNGASAIIVEEHINLDDYNNVELPIIKVKQIRKFIGYLSKNLYNDPTRRIPVIAITGSKGKTTTTFILTKILMMGGYNVGTIGTVGAFLNEKKFIELDNTTAEAFQTNEIINNMIKEGANIVILEVSSQSIVRDRVVGMHFEYSTFTNFSHDHISITEHPTLEAYYNAKIEIIKMAPIIVLNMDDKNVNKAKKLLKDKKRITYGSDKNNDIIIGLESIHYTDKGTEFELEYDNKRSKYKTSMLGKMAVYNIACAISIAKGFKIKDEVIKEAIKDVYVEGRFNFIPNNLGINIVIDYAHTEESLKQCLEIFRYITKGKVISLWGLSGQRDKLKRPKMGRISGELSDLTIITSEDPRDEDPEDIARDIAIGVKEVGGKYIIENDRKLAIRKAIDLAKPGDSVALLGKGQEKSQIFKDKEIYLNEKEIVEEYILLKNKE